MITRNPFVCSNLLQRDDLMESIKSFQEFAQANKELFRAFNYQNKALSNLFDPILIQNLTAFTQTHKFKEIIFPFQELDFEELRFSQRKIEGCFKYLPQLDQDVTLVEIFRALEGIPEEQYGEELLAKFGKKRLKSRRANKLRAKKLAQEVLLLFSIYSFLQFCGLPLPSTFKELVETIFNYPVQVIQDTKQHPAISKRFDKQVMIASVRKRKKRRHKHRRK